MYLLLPEERLDLWHDRLYLGSFCQDEPFAGITRGGHHFVPGHWTQQGLQAGASLPSSSST